MFPKKLALSAKEAAELIGVHENTLRALIARGELRAVRVGRRVLVPRAALEHLLEGQNPTQGEGGAK